MRQSRASGASSSRRGRMSSSSTAMGSVDHAHDAYAAAYHQQLQRAAELQTQGVALRLARRCQKAVRRIARRANGRG